MNKTIFRLFILGKIADLESQSQKTTSIEELHRIEGKMEVLRELFEDFNLEFDPEEQIEYHNNFWSEKNTVDIVSHKTQTNNEKTTTEHLMVLRLLRRVLPLQWSKEASLPRPHVYEVQGKVLLQGGYRKVPKEPVKKFCRDFVLSKIKFILYIVINIINLKTK